MKCGLEPLGMGPFMTEYSDPTKYAGKSQNFLTLAFWQLDVYLWNYYLSFLLLESSPNLPFHLLKSHILAPNWQQHQKRIKRWLNDGTAALVQAQSSGPTVLS